MTCSCACECEHLCMQLFVHNMNKNVNMVLHIRFTIAFQSEHMVVCPV